MNALLYSASEQSQTLNAGQLISFGTPVRRYGKNINMSGSNIAVQGEGYYPIHANVTFTAGGAGVATLQLFEDGVAIPGANASIQVAANTVYSLNVPTAIKIRCCEEKTVTAAIFNVATTVTNAGILVEKA